MKTITSKILFKRLQNELAQTHQYTLGQSGKKLISLRSPLGSRFGSHILNFDPQNGNLEVLLYPLRTNRHISDELLKPRIERFVQKIFDALVNKMVGGDNNGL